MSRECYLGIDIGTGSARAGLFDAAGDLLAMSTHPIRIWKPEADVTEQSSADIWQATCTAVREAVASAGVGPAQVRGIGFDATCSMVILGEGDQPLPASPDGPSEQNIIVWMDHRAKSEAEEITATGHEVLQFVGGVMSAEMQTPKLLWLKRFNPRTWQSATAFFDLSDWLVYRATGRDVRSGCTTTCKWTWQAQPGSSGEPIGWSDAFFREIGLEELADQQYAPIGSEIRAVGEAVGEGLTAGAASDLGLNPGTPVSTGIIDAHAGGLGLLGIGSDLDGASSSDEASSPDGASSSDAASSIEERLALIGGTSSCHMAVSSEPRFIDGVWGPYFSAMVPGMWLTEGGQSATGALVDHIIFSSWHGEILRKQAEEESTTVYELLNRRLEIMSRKEGVEHLSMLTQDLHVLPYFHGNRSPRADASLVGSIWGLTLSSDLDDLARLYLAAIQAIAYGTRHIIETMNGNGYRIRQIVATGGGAKNDLFLQVHADVCGCPITLPRQGEAVLLGSAVLGAVAAGRWPTVREAMERMNQPGRQIEPEEGEVRAYHEAKYRIFHKMHEDTLPYFSIMEAY